MAHRFLTLLLMGILGLAAFDGFEARRERRDPTYRSDTTMTTEAPAKASLADGTNPWPPPR